MKKEDFHTATSLPMSIMVSIQASTQQTRNTLYESELSFCRESCFTMLCWCMWLFHSLNFVWESQFCIRSQLYLCFYINTDKGDTAVKTHVYSNYCIITCIVIY